MQTSKPFSKGKEQCSSRDSGKTSLASIVTTNLFEKESVKLIFNRWLGEGSLLRAMDNHSRNEQHTQRQRHTGVSWQQKTREAELASR